MTENTSADADRLDRMASELIAANDNAPRKGREPVYRGSWPAINWARKRDHVGAAALWLVIKWRNPMMPANDNEPLQSGFGVDRRRNGVARGKPRPKQNLGKHLSLPGIIPRLGEVPREQVVGRVVRERLYETKPQLPEFSYGELETTRFGFLPPGVAKMAHFIGAAQGAVHTRPGVSRGSRAHVPDEPDRPRPPVEIEYTIELVAARSTLQDIGAALNYTGRYRTKAGASAVLAAVEWAKHATDIERYVTNRVA
jgi:hypothetical protein